MQTLWLSANVADEIRTQAERGYPHEVCGALAGAAAADGWRVTRCEAAENAWEALGLEPDDPAGPDRRFAIDPAWILRTDRALRAESMELVGFYHSHPDHPAVPSETDRRLLWPSVVQVICSVRGGRSDELKAWSQTDAGGPFREVPIEIRGYRSDTEMPVELSKEEMLRYSRHLIMPEVTLEGQRKLKGTSVLCIGAGGLGSPMALYLAAAGVGRLGLVEFDTVDRTNLQRQVLYSDADVGRPKIEAAVDRLRGVNPHPEYVKHEVRLTSENALDVFKDYDIIADGTDNFPTRYLVNDACVLLGKPNVYGSIFRFDGQLSIFHAKRGPCYRCLYPDPPPPGSVPSCAEGGVLGVLPGIVGSLQAAEVIKLALGVGEPMIGRLLLFDALGMEFRVVKVRKDPKCPICGEQPTIQELIDYEQFCGIRGEESHTAVGVEELPAMTVEELKAKLDAKERFRLIDVREPQEWQICHLDEATLIPLGEIPSRLHELDSAEEYVVHCKMGGRSAQAVELMRKAGFAKVHNLTGGITAWAQKIDTSMPQY